MKFKAFLSFVELQTKIASVIPFILGISYALYAFGSINVALTVIMFISMIFFDMTTTAINNYCDYKNEKKHVNHKIESRNPLIVFNISENKARVTIGIMLSIAIVFGCLLAFNTNMLVMTIGIICFIVGILYTYGPIPISRMPLGEVFSGIFVGLLIPFLTVYINSINQNRFGIYFSGRSVILAFDIISAVTILIIAIPIIVCIANIMLANNICDLEDDIKVKRYTIVYYIGKKVSVNIYKYLYYLAYLGIILGVIMKILPILSLLVLITLKPVVNNIKIFENKHVKSQTFILAIKNFVMISSGYIISLLIPVVIRNF